MTIFERQRLQGMATRRWPDARTEVWSALRTSHTVTSTAGESTQLSCKVAAAYQRYVADA